MSKAVLISVQPKWTELILEGSKTIEVRKTRPSIETPFKVYVYHTLPTTGDWNERAGRVVGEFTCDYIERYARIGTSGSPRTYYRKVEPGTFLAKDIDYKSMCLTPNEFADYGNGKVLYGWHISGLKVYDKPKKLMEFRLYKPCQGCRHKDSYHCLFHCDGKRSPERGPMSWGYVEEL